MVVSSLKQKLLDHDVVSKACRTSNPDIYATLPAKGFDIIWTLPALANLHYNHSFAIYRLCRNVRDNCRCTAVGYSIGDVIHLPEHFFLVKSSHFPGFIGNAKDDFSACPVCKGNHGLHIFVALRQGLLELYVLRLACKNFFLDHTDSSISCTCLSLSLAYSFSNIIQ